MLVPFSFLGGNDNPVAQAPVNTIAPVIVPSGNQVIGTLFTSGNGSWFATMPITFEYRWTRNGTPISGATSQTYTSVNADDGQTLRCEVRATNSFGVSAYVASSNSSTGISLPTNTVAPTLSPSGMQTTGTLITLSDGTWTGESPITFEYRWTRDNIVIVGETANTYTTVLGDDGTVIKGEVRGLNVAGNSAYVTSSNQVDATIFSQEYIDILERASVLNYALPTSIVQILQNTLVVNLISAGIWNKLDHLKIYAGTNEDFSLINWITPANFLSTRVNNPTYGYSFGFEGNATNAHLQTNFIPSGSLNYMTDDACYFTYRKTESTIGQLENFTGSDVFGSSEKVVLGSYGLDNFQTTINATLTVTANYSVSGTTGLTLLNRNNSTQHQVWLNGVNLATENVASTGLPTNQFLTCMIDNVGVSSNAQWSIEGAGGHLQNLDIVNLTNYFETYISAL